MLFRAYAGDDPVTDGRLYSEYRPLYDYRGDVVALVDEYGYVAETYRYDGFGRTQVSGAVVLADVSFDATTRTITTTSGDFSCLSGCTQIVVDGATATANNGTFTVTGVTRTTITLATGSTLVDELGSTATRYVTIGASDGRLAHSAVGSTFLFSTKLFDSETGLYDFGARWYDPETGRFLSPDPLGFVDGPNPYALCTNDPVNAVDPWGLAETPNGPGSEDAPDASDPDVQQAMDLMARSGQNPDADCNGIPDNGLAGFRGGGGARGFCPKKGRPANGLAKPTRAPAPRACGVYFDPALGEGRGGWRDSATGRITAAPPSNPVPPRMARVIPSGVPASTLGRPGSGDVYVTAAADVAGMSAAQIAARLAIPESPTGYLVIEFGTPEAGVASPVFRSDPGFIGGGITAGGAREFVIPNGPIPVGASTRRVP